MLSHYEQCLQHYMEARRSKCEKDINDIKKEIENKAIKGEAKISILTRNFKENLPDIIAELKKEFYDPRIDGEYIVILLDKSWEEYIPETIVKHIEYIYIGREEFIIVSAVTSFILYTLFYLLCGGILWGFKEGTPEWPSLFKWSLFFVPILFVFCVNITDKSYIRFVTKKEK